MNYSIEVTPYFEKDFKKLLKKYDSLKEDLLILIHSLKENPTQGTYLGRDCYKIRLAISSKGKGKSGGARIITFIAFNKEKVFLLAIYDKPEKETLTVDEIRSLVNAISIENLN
jgi:mRNA-degrading endonuclease RelE of RelBE toxin-antitoxin system